jgi:hypothetical protein
VGKLKESHKFKGSISGGDAARLLSPASRHTLSPEALVATKKHLTGGKWPLRGKITTLKTLQLLLTERYNLPQNSA